MKNTISCPRCGSRVAKNSDVCPACGFDIKAYRESNQVQESLPGIVLIPVLLAVILVIVLSFQSIRRLSPNTFYRLRHLESVLRRQVSSVLPSESSGAGSGIQGKKKIQSYEKSLVLQSSDILTITEAGWVRNGQLLQFYAWVRNDAKSGVAIMPYVEVTVEHDGDLLGSCKLNAWTIPCGEERLLVSSLRPSHDTYLIPDTVTFAAQEDCGLSQADPSWNPLMVDSVTIEENSNVTVIVRNDNDTPVRFASVSILITNDSPQPVWIADHPLYEDVPAFGESSWTFMPFNLDLTGCTIEVCADGYFPEEESFE